MRYRVADIDFEIRLLDREDLPLLPSFEPFAVPEQSQPAAGPSEAAVVQAAGTSLPTLREVSCFSAGQGFRSRTLLEHQETDMGHSDLFSVPDGYLVEVAMFPGGPKHSLYLRTGCADGEFLPDWADRCAGDALCSLARVWFSMICIKSAAVSIHASAISVPASVLSDGASGRCGLLFMGKSGTGKSTHSSLWLKNIPGSELLNDDNPVIRLFPADNGTSSSPLHPGVPNRHQLRVYGSPWSGSRDCYRNKSYPVGAMVRLRQASFNRLSRLDEISSIMAILPGCSLIRFDLAAYDEMCDTISEIADIVPVAVLDCLPDDDAALVCARSLAISCGGD